MRLTDEEKLAGKLTPEHEAEAIRTFKDAGYILLDNVYDLAFLETARESYEIEIATLLKSKGGLEALDGQTFGKKHIGFFPLMFAPLADERIIAPPIAVQLLDKLLGSEMQSSFFHSNTCFPGSGYQAIHRDSGHIFGCEMSNPGPVTHVVINIPLVECSEENGSTEIWPGTHLIVDDNPDEGIVLESRAANMPIARMNAPLGSLVLRDLRLWHRGVPNNSDQPRPMFAIVYQGGWLKTEPMTIPQTTWDGWSKTAQQIYRNNTVVPDEVHFPRVWYP